MPPAVPPTAVVGRWTLDRTIHDRLADAELRVDGTLQLTQESADHIAWHESGHLHRGNDRLPVWRSYALVRRPDGWMVTFDDGRDFHPWAPDHEAVHPCAADTYRGRYDLSGLPTTWTVRWDVTGPAKDYTMWTTLTATSPHP